MTQTLYVHRVTIAAPAAHIDDANALSLVLGEVPADINTFNHAGYQDAEGNLYSVVSTVVKEVFVTGANSELVAPSFAPEADLEAAGRAQALLNIGSLESPVQATPDSIAVILGDRFESAMDQVAALGLEAVPFEEEMTGT